MNRWFTSKEKSRLFGTTRNYRFAEAQELILSTNNLFRND